ncbi:MAG: methyltransferase domain-containing protein [Candidatus Rokubacteria bacterium]|nr:methyltransferase domain-containing protein [Candidatus Rokubacteria bacterium]
MKYVEPIAPNDFKRPQVMIARAVPAGVRVLDVGCAGGRIAALLKTNGCYVVGVERDPALAALAKEVCDDVIVGDLEDPDIVAILPDGFAAIVCSDILEHLREPERLLRALRGKLGRCGRVYASIPNFLTWRMRLRLVRGEFRYEPTGLMDETHLRFFSYESALALCHAGGYRVVTERIAWDVPLGNRVAARQRARPGRVAALMTLAAERVARAWPGLFAVHFVFSLEPDE